MTHEATYTDIITSPPPLWSHHGDKIIVHATNGLGVDSIPTALHAHGMIFNGTNYYDGAVGITQCGIPNGHTLDYEIDTVHNVSTAAVADRERRLTHATAGNILDPRPLLGPVRRRSPCP